MAQRDHCSGRFFRFTLATLSVLVLLSTATPSASRGVCLGDCNGDRQVTINEIITLVNIALGTVPCCETCPAAEAPWIGIAGLPITYITDVIRNALFGCPADNGVCGDGQVGGIEECDDGGICIGGSNAGTACTADAQCNGNGVCDDGLKQGYACSANSDCPDGHCVHCKTFGGDGCAANCTDETEVDFPLVSGVATGDAVDLIRGTSGAVIHGDIFTIPVPFTGEEKLTVGKPGGDGRVPFVVKAASVHIAKVEVSTLGEACVRAVALQTCGGTVFEADGTESPSCGLGFIETNCAHDKPCASTFGSGNSASGVLGCGSAGLGDVDLNVTQDAGGQAGNPGPIFRSISGTGPPGSARLLNSVSITSRVGIDPEFCKDGEPLIPFGQVSTTLLTTGTACCQLQNINGEDGLSTGPFCVTGTPFNCGALQGKPLTGGVAGAVPLLGQLTVGDICVTSQFFAWNAP
jgi:hypothetical protein